MRQDTLPANIHFLQHSIFLPSTTMETPHANFYYCECEPSPNSCFLSYMHKLYNTDGMPANM